MLRPVVICAVAIASLALVGPAAAQSPEPGDPGTSPELRAAGLVPVRTHAPSIELEVHGLTKQNLTGKPLPGYCKPWALLRSNAARAIARAHYTLRKKGFGLRVYDAYRPVRATNALVRWAEKHGQGQLVGVVIARRSNHNLGSAVDLTVVNRETGKKLDMGTDVDDTSERSTTLAVSGKALENRLRLKRALEAQGFRNYAREWWHYDFFPLGPKRIDIPLGCG